MKLVQAHIHDRYTAAHFFKIDNFILNFLELFFAVLQLGVVGLVDWVIATGGSEVNHTHTAFDARLEVNVLIE
ncbi:hypothetical protein D3C72_2344680 [compost metagenome]